MMYDTSETTARKTYSQDWPAYNLAQTNEKARFLELLYELCAGVEEPPQTFGRPRLPFAEMLFCAVYKVYSTFSSRRFVSDMWVAKDRGYVSKVPHFNTVSNYMEMESLTPYLKQLITASALPLRAIEWDFAGTRRASRQASTRSGLTPSGAACGRSTATRNLTASTGKTG
jgi:hypothetical protein